MIHFKYRRCLPFTISQIFFKLTLGGGVSDMSRDTHCATCHKLVFLKLYLGRFSSFGTRKRD